jgi:hypothetical protein
MKFLTRKAVETTKEKEERRKNIFLRYYFRPGIFVGITGSDKKSANGNFRLIMKQ